MSEINNSPFGLGPRFITSLAMVDYVEDWSRVRSPSRAERRRKRGFQQNIRTIAVPKKVAVTTDGGRTFIVHPEMLRELRALTERAPQ